VPHDVGTHPQRAFLGHDGIAVDKKNLRAAAAGRIDVHRGPRKLYRLEIAFRGRSALGRHAGERREEITENARPHGCGSGEADKYEHREKSGPAGS